MLRSRWTLLTVVLLGCSLSCHKSRGDYPEQAFSELSSNSPPAVGQEAEEKIRRIILELRKSAAQKKLYAAQQTEATKLGYRAFPAITPLLRDPDPWVRASALTVLFELDRRRSTPFLVGVLLDVGKIQFKEDDVFVDTTISHQAAGYLAAAFHGSVDFITPLDEIGQPQAEERAQQRWWAYHLQFCDWRNTAYGTECWLNYEALYSHIPADDLAGRLKSAPDNFKYVPVVWAQASQLSRIGSKGQPMLLKLIFQNFGTEMPPMTDHSNLGTHIFRMVGPDGRDIPATPKLNEIVKTAVIAPPVSTWNAYAWEIDLGSAYDILHSGRYRVYYRYLPPKSLRNSMCGQPLELQSWNGREYVNYYDFLVK